jgi:transformation/transcription domain-associated protein
MRGKTLAFDLAFRKHVAANIDSMVNRAELMACKIEREQVRYIER